MIICNICVFSRYNSFCNVKEFVIFENEVGYVVYENEQLCSIWKWISDAWKRIFSVWKWIFSVWKWICSSVWKWYEESESECAVSKNKCVLPKDVSAVFENEFVVSENAKLIM